MFLLVCVILFTRGSLHDVTSYLAAWPHVLSGGSLSRGVFVQRGLCPEGSLSRGSLSREVFVQVESLSRKTPRRIIKSERYTSYWNAFFLTFHC